MEFSQPLIFCKHKCHRMFQNIPFHFFCVYTHFCVKKKKLYFASTISLIAVFSSPSIVISTKVGMLTKFFPNGATNPLAIQIDLIA